MPQRTEAARSYDSLTLVLPAYNEEDRLGPALDELFGYLRRRGGPPREGAPPSANLPGRIHVLVVDEGARTARRSSSERGPKRRSRSATPDWPDPGAAPGSIS